MTQRREMTARIYVGIDPGIGGGIAAVHPSGLIIAAAMPTKMIPTSKKPRQAMDLEQMQRIFSRTLEAASYPVMFGLEQTQTRPENARMSDLHAFEAAGEIRGLLCGMRHPPVKIEAKAWTNKLGFCGKHHFGALEQRFDWVARNYPDCRSLITGPRGGILSGPVDAICIALYMKTIHGSPIGKWGVRQPKCFGLSPEDKALAKRGRIGPSGGQLF
jgi:hypothetical protein